MINKTHRFHGLGSLNYVYRHGKTVRLNGLLLRYIVNERRTTYRCAVVVSKKVHKSAVARNRIRRRMYEAVRLATSETTKPYDLVFTITNEQITGLNAGELHQIVGQLLKEAGSV